MTVEKIAWIVGTNLGSIWESEAAWAKKIMGPDRIRRIYVARSIVCLLLHDVCNASYTEIARVMNRRHESVIGRSIAQGRKWAAENESTYRTMRNTVARFIESEQARHRKALKTSMQTAD